MEQLLKGTPLGAQFVNVAREAGLRAATIFGGKERNRFLLETTGCGVAFFDYDHDGWLDLFFVNGTRFEASWTQANEPTSRLYQEQSRRHVHRRDTRLRPRPHRLGPGLLHRRLR